jgi:hypothetical protein
MVVGNGIEDMLGLSTSFHKPHGMEFFLMFERASNQLATN